MSKILICDDDPEALESTSMLLRDAGYDVTAAHEHKEFLARLKEFTPDVIILDIRMPERDGIWIAENLQALGSRIPIIFLTGCSSTIYRLYAPFVGSIGYLTKPADRDTLLKKIARAISNTAPA
jgi:DNA-binding response OmpR family regulator